MLSKEKSKKLIPLRVVARDGIYSKEYLSQLVHRKKLKAKRIGRNYFTSWFWFNEYLENHASAEVRERINSRIIIPEIKAAHSATKESGFLLPIPPIMEPIKAPPEEELKNKKAVIGFLPLKYILTAVLAVLIILSVVNFYREKDIVSSDANGNIAGISEENPALIDSKGELEDGYMMYDDSLYRVSDSVSSSGKDIFMLEEVNKN